MPTFHRSRGTSPPFPLMRIEAIGRSGQHRSWRQAQLPSSARPQQPRWDMDAYASDPGCSPRRDGAMTSLHPAAQQVGSRLKASTLSRNAASLASKQSVETLPMPKPLLSSPMSGSMPGGLASSASSSHLAGERRVSRLGHCGCPRDGHAVRLFKPSQRNHPSRRHAARLVYGAKSRFKQSDGESRRTNLKISPSPCESQTRFDAASRRSLRVDSRARCERRTLSRQSREADGEANCGANYPICAGNRSTARPMQFSG
jgi:hypothetical protein